jgi:hypothetical protein
MYADVYLLVKFAKAGPQAKKIDAAVEDAYLA